MNVHSYTGDVSCQDTVPNCWVNLMLWLEQIGGVQNCTANKPFELKVSLVWSRHTASRKRIYLFLFLWRFFLSLFFLLCVAILWRFLFLPQGIL